MNDEPEAIARSIIDANRYMPLGTSDDDGAPWVTPVFYATSDYNDFYWMSSPEARHSVNLARRPQVSIVIFDSSVLPGHGQAVYMSALAEEVAADEVERCLRIYPGPASRGARAFPVSDFVEPSPFRLYRARVSEHFILCPKEPGQPCFLHGRRGDHRLPVTV